MFFQGGTRPPHCPPKGHSVNSQAGSGLSRSAGLGCGGNIERGARQPGKDWVQGGGGVLPAVLALMAQPALRQGSQHERSAFSPKVCTWERAPQQSQGEPGVIGVLWGKPGSHPRHTQSSTLRQ